MADAKKNEKTVEKANGALVFESMGTGFEIPTRTRSGAYDDVLEKLKTTKGVVCIFKSGDDAKPCNTRRKALIKSAEKKGLDIQANVRNIEGKGNCLLVQYIGLLKPAGK